MTHTCPRCTVEIEPGKNTNAARLARRDARCDACVNEMARVYCARQRAKPGNAEKARIKSREWTAANREKKQVHNRKKIS